MRSSFLITLLIAPVFAHAAEATPAVGGAVQDTEIAANAAPSSPGTPPLSPSSDMIFVPMHDLRDAMLYLGGRVSSDEMAAVVYRELGNDFVAAQKTVAPRR